MSPDAPGCLGFLFKLLGLHGAGDARPRNPYREGPPPGDPGHLGIGPGVAEEPGLEAVPPRLDVYRVRDDLLSPAEDCFFRVLRLVAGERYLVWPKVSLGDIFYVTQPHRNQAARARIAQKHVNFLLCDPATLRPVLGLELDDGSHQGARGEERDRFKDAVFAAAGLPLVRVPVRSAYECAQLAALLEGAAGPGPARGSLEPEPPGEPAAEPSEPPEPDLPRCPKCGVPMALRTARRGENRGGRFWGCVHYPRCRQVIPLGEQVRDDPLPPHPWNGPPSPRPGSGGPI